MLLEARNHPLCVSLRSGVPFVGNYENTSNLKKTGIYPFNLQEDGFQSRGMLNRYAGKRSFIYNTDTLFLDKTHSKKAEIRSKKAGGQRRVMEPRPLDWIYMNLIDSNKIQHFSDPESSETILPFPYDPTFQCPFLIGDKVVNRGGETGTISGFYLKEDGIRVVIEDSSEGAVYVNHGFEYWRLRERVVVDWETYLVEVLHRTKRINQGLRVPHVAKRKQTVPLYDLVADAHVKTCEIASHRPEDSVRRSMRKNAPGDYSLGYDEFEQNPQGLWRIYARTIALNSVLSLYKHSDTPSEKRWAEEVLGSRHTGTMVEYGEALRKVDNGVIRGGAKAVKPMEPRYDPAEEEVRRATTEGKGENPPQVTQVSDEELTDEERLTEFLEEGL